MRALASCGFTDVRGNLAADDAEKNRLESSKNRLESSRNRQESSRNRVQCSKTHKKFNLPSKRHQNFGLPNCTLGFGVTCNTSNVKGTSIADDAGKIPLDPSKNRLQHTKSCQELRKKHKKLSFTSKQHQNLLSDSTVGVTFPVNDIQKTQKTCLEPSKSTKNLTWSDFTNLTATFIDSSDVKINSTDFDVLKNRLEPSKNHQNFSLSNVKTTQGVVLNRPAIFCGISDFKGPSTDVQKNCLKTFKSHKHHKNSKLIDNKTTPEGSSHVKSTPTADNIKKCRLETSKCHKTHKTFKIPHLKSTPEVIDNSSRSKIDLEQSRHAKDTVKTSKSNVSLRFLTVCGKNDVGAEANREKIGLESLQHGRNHVKTQINAYSMPVALICSKNDVRNNLSKCTSVVDVKKSVKSSVGSSEMNKNSVITLETGPDTSKSKPTPLINAVNCRTSPVNVTSKDLQTSVAVKTNNINANTTKKFSNKSETIAKTTKVANLTAIVAKITGNATKANAKVQKTETVTSATEKVVKTANVIANTTDIVTNTPNIVAKTTKDLDMPIISDYEGEDDVKTDQVTPADLDLQGRIVVSNTTELEKAVDDSVLPILVF